MGEEVNATDLPDAIARDGSIDGGFLLGYVLISEWMTGEGKRWLSAQSGTGAGEDIPPWQVHGYMHEVLNNWVDDDFTEDEEE